MIDWGIVGERGIRNFGNNVAVLQHPHAVFADHATDFDRVESPLAEHFVNFFFAAFLRHQQHALLRFAQQNFVGAHAGLTLRDAVHLNLNSNVAACAHLTGGASEPRGSHVLNADDRAGLHGFKACLEQQLL